MVQIIFTILVYVLVASCVPSCHARTSSWSGKTLSLHDDSILLQGTTVLEAPFIYSESGPYTGYCVDVIKEISAQVGFNFSLRQSPDGQIGSVKLMNGVYRELAREYAEFAIGDISRNWLNDERAAVSAGVLFTKPILTSTLSVLIAKSLLHEIGQNKTNECMRKLSEPNNQTNSSSSVRSFRCMEQVTFDDIFELPQLNRLIIQGSAVHEYFTNREPSRLSDLILAEKSSLFGYGLEKLKHHPYVLIDETKFTEYFADQNCEFGLIDASGRLHDELFNVKIDESIPAPALSRARFRNEIVIALSSSMVLQHKKLWKRDWLADFNRAIEQMQRNGKLRQLQNKHWLNHCRKNDLTNQANSPVAHFLVVVTSVCLWLALDSNLL